MTEQYKYGFTYKEINFGWKNKKLFRLPSTKNKRSYSLRELPEISIGNKKGYRVVRDKKTIDQLMDFTEVVNFTYTINGKQDDDCPW